MRLIRLIWRQLKPIGGDSWSLFNQILLLYCDISIQQIIHPISSISISPSSIISSSISCNFFDMLWLDEDSPLLFLSRMHVAKKWLSLSISYFRDSICIYSSSPLASKFSSHVGLTHPESSMLFFPPLYL